VEASFGDVPLQRPAAIATSTLPVPLQGLDPEGKHGRIGFVTTNECAAEDLRQLTEVNRVCAGEPVVVTYDPRSAETPEKVRADSKSLSGLIVNAYLPSFSRALALASRQRDMVRNSDYPDGFPWLMGYHLRRAQEGNSTRDTALEACRAADEEGIPWIVYAPEKSTKREAKGIPASIWDCDKAVALAGGPGRKHGAVYMCSFGWCAAGPTRLLACRANINPPARPGCPLWDEAGGYGGPLPPWCGHRHNKSRHAAADKHFPRAFYAYLLKMLPGAGSVARTPTVGGKRCPPGPLHEKSQDEFHTLKHGPQGSPPQARDGLAEGMPGPEAQDELHTLEHGPQGLPPQARDGLADGTTGPEAPSTPTDLGAEGVQTGGGFARDSPGVEASPVPTTPPQAPVAQGRTRRRP